MNAQMLASLVIGTPLGWAAMAAGVIMLSQMG